MSLKKIRGQHEVVKRSYSSKRKLCQIVVVKRRLINLQSWVIHSNQVNWKGNA